MILIDVNILVYAHREDAPDHDRYRSWLEAAMDGPQPCGLSELVLSGCLRVITHPRVFMKPTPLETAIDFVQCLRTHDNVRIAAPGRRHWDIFLELCRSVRARGTLIPDAYHAALAIETGAEWITADTGFARFPGLNWRRPWT